LRVLVNSILNATVQRFWGWVELGIFGDFLKNGQKTRTFLLFGTKTPERVADRRYNGIPVL
jgi:hypothetical protein